MKREGFPTEGELVVCTITKLNPYSAFALLEEYNRTGMVHISEASSRWIKDIREALREGQRVVCRVLNIDRERGHIGLSVKRVRKEESIRKINEFKAEEKAEKLLEAVGKERGKTFDETYDELGRLLQDRFGLLFKAFKVAQKDRELLVRKGVPVAWADAMESVAKKTFERETVTLKGELDMSSDAANGITIIKGALIDAQKKGANVRYISAPRYSISLSGSDPKTTEKTLVAIANQVVRDIRSRGGEADFRLVK